jgi:hypothetical protein
MMIVYASKRPGASLLQSTRKNRYWRRPGKQK